MKYAFSILLGIFLSACTPSLGIENNIQGETRQTILVKRNNPTIHAIQYIGLTERADRQELKEYTGVDPVRTEWCAAFVNAVLDETGIEGSASVSDYPLTARSFLRWGINVTDPQPGDIIVFPRGNSSWQGHVGFYLKTQQINGVDYYLILGGNQNNKVSIVPYRASRALGIRRKSPINT
jgi:uncharacterized protein (TIGR02594 family)